LLNIFAFVYDKLSYPNQQTSTAYIIVTHCRYLINYMKDSCCFIDDYCTVIMLSCAL